MAYTVQSDPIARSYFALRAFNYDQRLSTARPQRVR